MSNTPLTGKYKPVLFFSVLFGFGYFLEDKITFERWADEFQPTMFSQDLKPLIGRLVTARSVHCCRFIPHWTFLRLTHTLAVRCFVYVLYVQYVCGTASCC